MSDYTTTANVKLFTRTLYTDYRSMTTAQYDALVASLITRVSARMEAYCGRDWALHTNDDETFNVGAYHMREIPIMGPVISVTNVYYRDGPTFAWSAMSAQDYTYENKPLSDQVKRGNISPLMRQGFGAYETGRLLKYWATRIGSPNWLRWRVVFWRGYQNVRVVYTWGYATTPAIIEDVCIRMVDHILHQLLKSQAAKVGAVSSSDEVGSSITYDIPDDCKEDLNKWKSTSTIFGV